MSNEIAVYEMPEIIRMGEAIAKSGLFGIKTVDQAVALCLIAQAEGRHPALAARDYDIIQGRPSKKAEAMLRDFLSAGGAVQWHSLTDDLADATFSHPSGGSARISWDLPRARKAGLGSNPMYAKYPRQMLRSRVVSEGVRTIWPLATGGMYVPEEISAFDDRVDVTPEPDPEPVAPTPNIISDADHQAETFAIIDLDGVEHEFATAKHAAEALKELFRASAVRGREHLNGAAESNDPLVTYMDAAGYTQEVDGTLALLKELRQSLKAAAQPVQQREPRSLLSDLEDETPQQEAAAEVPGAIVELPAGMDPLAYTPELHAVIQAKRQPSPPVIERNPWYDQESLEVRPKLKNGRPDWATWIEVQFLPRVKGALTTRDMSMTMGDNEAHIVGYKAAVGTENAKVFDQIVANQWAAIGEREK